MDIQFFAAEIDPYIETIDLHNTNNITDAIELFEREIAQVAVRNIPYVRVIHGIGTGKLKEKLEEIFNKHPLIVDWKLENHGGSTLLLL